MPKRKENLSMKEAELAKTEELNRRLKKALNEKAELIRQQKELDDAERSLTEGEEVPEAVAARGVRVGAWGSEDPALEEKLTVLAGDGSMLVYRVSKTGADAQVGKFPLSEWEDRLETIAKDYGGGSFRVRFTRPDGTYVAARLFTFDEKAYAKEPAAPASSGGDVMALVMAQLQDARREAADARKESSELIRAMILAQNQGGFVKSAQDIALIGNMFKGKDEGNAMDAFLKGLSMGRELSAGAEPPSTLDKVLETVGRPMAEVLSKVALNAPQPVRPGAVPKPLAPPPGGAPEPKPPVAPVEAPVNHVKDSFVYKMYVPRILEMARAKADPAETAETVVDMFPAIYHDDLLGYVERPDLVEFLGGFEAEAAQHAEWIKSVAAEISKLFPAEAAEGEERPDGLQIPDAAAEAIAEAAD